MAHQARLSSCQPACVMSPSLGLGSAAQPDSDDRDSERADPDDVRTYVTPPAFSLGRLAQPDSAGNRGMPSLQPRDCVTSPSSPVCSLETASRLRALGPLPSPDGRTAAPYWMPGPGPHLPCTRLRPPQCSTTATTGKLLATQ